MNNPTVRLELGDGDYAIFLEYLRHDTSREVQKVLRKFATPRKILVSELKPGSKLVDDIEMDLSGFDPCETQHVFMLGQITEWSFGPVNAEVLNSIPEDKSIFSITAHPIMLI